MNNSVPENPDDILENSFLSEPEADIAFDHKELKLPSKFNPPMPSTLEHIYDILIDRILSHSPDFSRQRNMTLEQYNAMTRLKENENIIIKKADKGSNVVIQNKSDYTTEGLRQLSESKFYKQIDKDLTFTHRKQIHDFIGELYLNKEFLNKHSNFFQEVGIEQACFICCPKFIRINSESLEDPLSRVVTAPLKRFL